MDSFLKYDGDATADLKVAWAFTGTATLDWMVNGQGTAGTSDLVRTSTSREPWPIPRTTDPDRQHQPRPPRVACSR